MEFTIVDMEIQSRTEFDDLYLVKQLS